MRKKLLFTFCLCFFSTISAISLTPAKIGITTLRLNDEERRRPVLTEVWYPVEEGAHAESVAGLWVRCPEARDAPLQICEKKKYPLVVMSHGNCGDRTNISWLAEILAAKGYIVAAMDHHGNTWNNNIADCFIKIWERPRDVSFVIDELLTNSRFAPYIDHKRIGFVGYSLGGMTGLWIAGGKLSHFDKIDLSAIPSDQIPKTLTPDMLDLIDFAPAKVSYRDARVGAVFLMAPALVNLFDLKSLSSIQVPVHIIASDGDTIVPADTNAKVLAGKIGKSIMTLIPGGGSHYIFLNEVTRGGKMMLDKSVVTDPPHLSRKDIHENIGSLAIEFFNANLK
jgi:predicted dienelactone hydrolase